MREKDLRKSSIGKQAKWTTEQIEAGLRRFKTEYGRYPSSHEIDNYPYLPSARSIQRTHSGLASVRNGLGFDESDINLTKGLVRSQKAKVTYANAVNYESKFYKYLTSKIAEVRVHEHKILRPGHVCCDFYIYTSKREGYAIDIFYAQDLFTLQRIINIKYARYRTVKCPVYFVLVGNKNVTQQEIDKLINNRRHKFPNNIKVLTEASFKRSVI